MASAVIVAVATAALAPAAEAAVRIGPTQVVVSTSGARAVISRAPFRLIVQDRAGRTVLSEVPNTGQTPLVVPPAPDPQPLGADNLDGPTLYAPLSFLVGAERRAEFPATQYVGNLLAGTEAGVEYSARDVVSARRVGAGAELVLSTSDPSGRQLVVLVRPARRGAIRVSARADPADDVATLADSFATASGEAFHGFGGRHNSIDQRGNDFFNWIQQQNTGAGPLQPVLDAQPGSGGESYLFPNGPAAAFYVQSQFVSSRSYGFLLDRDELSGWRMASDREDAWQVSVSAPAIDYVVAAGRAPHAVRTLTAIGGRHRAPPGWALGPQLDRLTRFGSESRESYRRSVEDDLRDIERFRLPLAAYRIEAWEWLEPDHLRSVIRRLRRRGIMPLFYFRAFVGKDDIGTDDPADFDTAVNNGWVAKTPTGQPYIFISNFLAPAAMIDFTDRAAVRWWQGRIREALELGAEGFMQDFGEQVQHDMVFENGQTGTSMHNRYPVLFHRATREAVRAFEREHPRRRVFFYTRAGYSGTPGAAGHEGANFPGDETTDWSRSSGLRSLATDMLNRGVGGAFGFGTDIGGYFDFHTPPTTKELFIRWAQWAVLSPVMRLHGSINAGTHTPWTFDAQTVRIYNDLSRLRLRARGLIGRLWRRAARTGMPVARPLYLHYPRDPTARRQDQQWLLGPDVLVAPVVHEGARSRRVYFPGRGACWYHPQTRKRYRGAASRTVEAPLTRLPYFFRCGTRPFARRSQRSPAQRRPGRGPSLTG